MLGFAFAMYDLIVDDSFGHFSVSDEIKDYRTEFNPYLLCHYLHQNYVHHEMMYNSSTVEQYQKVLKYVTTTLSEEEDEFLKEFFPNDIVDVIASYTPISFESFKLKRSLHFDLERVFGDNSYEEGGRFVYNGPASIAPINTLKIVGRVPYQSSERPSRTNLRIHYICSDYIYREGTLFWATIGFQRPNGFYECPRVLYKICES